MLVGIGLGASGLLLIGILALVYGLGLKPKVEIQPPAAAGELVLLWDAYEQARSAARAEAGDALLVSASTQWQAASKEALLAGAEAWLFVFYSPANGHVLDVVTGGGGAQVTNQTRVWVAPDPLTGQESWEAGPQDALLIFLAHGGQQFLESRPQAVVNVRGAESDAGPMWTVVALDPGDRGVLSLRIDATTNQVLFVAP
jgi:hypothetical protein